MGHGGRTSVGSPAGMSSRQQQAVMADFRQPGRRLLVSTSAAEEGIDVPRCQFVVRYAATQTGAAACRRVARMGLPASAVSHSMACFFQPVRSCLSLSCMLHFLYCSAGRERVQSAGRARKFGSRFVEIIEATHEELSLIRKSRAEEANMKAAVRALGALGLAG